MDGGLMEEYFSKVSTDAIFNLNGKYNMELMSKHAI
jgi:hypothetical protein